MNWGTFWILGKLALECFDLSWKTVMERVISLEEQVSLNVK